jgi:hypothetical protein
MGGAFRWDHMDGFHSSRPEPCGGSLMLTEKFPVPVKSVLCSAEKFSLFDRVGNSIKKGMIASG